MTIRMRDFQWHEDFGRVMEFLTEIIELTQSLRTWIPNRFENRRFGPCGPEYLDEEDALVKIWEDTENFDSSNKPRIVAVGVFSDSPDSFLNLHPDYKHLDKELLVEMERIKAAMPPTDERGLRIAFFVEVGDTNRINLMKDLGYNDLGVFEHNRVRPLDLPIPNYELPDGYSIRHVLLPEDYVNYHEVVGSVFSHCGKYMTEKAAVKYSKASFWHEGLDLVAVAPDGKFAAFTTVRLDPSSGIAEFEPVGTHPDYRKLGLAKAIILEGLKRLQKYNPTLICIPGAATTEGATRLYDSLGFTRTDVRAWRKFL